MGTKRAAHRAGGIPAAEPTPVQLRLIGDGRPRRRDWALDADTRRVGRRGVSEAREILRRTRRERRAS